MGRSGSANPQPPPPNPRSAPASSALPPPRLARCSRTAPCCFSARYMRPRTEIPMSEQIKASLVLNPAHALPSLAIVRHRTPRPSIASELTEKPQHFSYKRPILILYERKAFPFGRGNIPQGTAKSTTAERAGRGRREGGRDGEGHRRVRQIPPDGFGTCVSAARGPWAAPCILEHL